MSKIIELKNVNKWFDKFQALKDVNLEVNQQEKIVICGPSGSGKSTLVRCINSLEQHNSGNIIVHGKEVNKNQTKGTEVSSEVGMVFQQFNLFPHLTVKENLQLAQYIANKNDNTRIESILKNLNIFEKSDKKTNQLSQGEKQRVSIALAIVNSPKLILADEPTSSLDDNNCSKVIKLLKKQATDFGAQLIVITHDSRLKKHFKKSIEL